VSFTDLLMLHGAATTKRVVYFDCEFKSSCVQLLAVLDQRVSSIHV